MTLFKAWQDMMDATRWHETDETVAPSAAHSLLQEPHTIFLVPIEEKDLKPFLPDYEVPDPDVRAFGGFGRMIRENMTAVLLSGMNSTYNLHEVQTFMPSRRD